jgi:hypothetical protein
MVAIPRPGVDSLSARRCLAGSPFRQLSDRTLHRMLTLDFRDGAVNGPGYLDVGVMDLDTEKSEKCFTL